MAGLAAHLIIAREVHKLLPKGTIRDVGQFYAGSIAPDAIHARVNYVRAEKKHTHLRDEIPDKDFIQEFYRNLFLERVASFILLNRDRQDGLLDAYRGYVVHLLTDELYLLTLRREFVKRMEKLGITQNDREFFHRIITDMNRNDFLLLYSYQEKEEIRFYLEQVQPFGIDDMLSVTEVSESREWVINRFFREEYELQDPVYVSFDSTREFVRMAAENIKDRLSEGGSLPMMF
jgi:hypothetical protein